MQDLLVNLFVSVVFWIILSPIHFILLFHSNTDCCSTPMLSDIKVKDASEEVISATMKAAAAVEAFGEFEQQHVDRAFFVAQRFTGKPFWTSQGKIQHCE